MQVDPVKQKKEFAAAWLRCNEDAHKAAFIIVPNDPGMALQIALAWPKDPVVLAEKELLLGANDAKTFLPSKEKQARDVYDMACSTLIPVEDRLKAHRLYAELMGHIEKAAPTTAVNILSQGVMIVKDNGTDDQWERKAMAQQRTLIN